MGGLVRSPRPRPRSNTMFADPVCGAAAVFTTAGVARDPPAPGPEPPVSYLVLPPSRLETFLVASSSLERCNSSRAEAARSASVANPTSRDGMISK